MAFMRMMGRDSVAYHEATVLDRADDHPAQLGAVGPGGAMAALMARHPDLVTTLNENVRQHDPTERQAVADLRAGHVGAALDWYARNDRIRHAPTLDDTLDRMVTAWNNDVAAGRSTTMLAWRRDHVAELNTRARSRRHHSRAGHRPPARPRRRAGGRGR